MLIEREIDMAVINWIHFQATWGVNDREGTLRKAMYTTLVQAADRYNNELRSIMFSLVDAIWGFA